MSEKGEKDERPATIRLDNDLYRRVATVAVEENRSVSGQIRDFIEKGLQAQRTDTERARDAANYGRVARQG